jgi:phosphonoacetaldehyde hydrolase
MRFVAVIFDWAGTMVDFGSLAPVFAMRRAFDAYGLALDDAEIRASMGLAKRDHVKAIFANPRVARSWSLSQGGEPNEGDIDRVYESIGPLMREEGAARMGLIPGAGETVAALRAHGVRIGSTTGYTRDMMDPILKGAAHQGYRPDTVVCAGDTSIGRPAPFMIWRALTDLEIWPTSAVAKIDDAPVGIAEGKNAGCYTIGVAASGNAMGLTAEAYASLSISERNVRLTAARTELLAAGADLVIDTVADLPTLLT